MSGAVRQHGIRSVASRGATHGALVLCDNESTVKGRQT